MTACIYFTQVSHTSKGSTDASGCLTEQVCLVGGRGRRRWWRGPCLNMQHCAGGREWPSQTLPPRTGECSRIEEGPNVGPGVMDRLNF